MGKIKRLKKDVDSGDIEKHDEKQEEEYNPSSKELKYRPSVAYPPGFIKDRIRPICTQLDEKY